MDGHEKENNGASFPPGSRVMLADGCETRTGVYESTRARTLMPSRWDLKELMERLEGDQEFLRELLVIFQQEAHTNVEKARAALGSGDFATLARAAHTLKGMLRNLAMGAAAQTASDLEQTGRKELRAESERGLQQLEKDLAELFPEVEGQLAEVKS